MCGAQSQPGCSKGDMRQAKYYDVTFRHVRITIVAVEKQCVLHILSVCL